jgi:hypothetical protein
VWAVWFVVKILLVAVGLRRPRGRVSQLVYPALLLSENGPAPVIVPTTEALRSNPLRLNESERALLIDFAANVFTLSHTRRRGGDLRALWRIIAPSPLDYSFELRWERSGWDRAKRRLLASEAIDDGLTMTIHRATGMKDVIAACEPRCGNHAKVSDRAPFPSA